MQVIKLVELEKGYKMPVDLYLESLQKRQYYVSWYDEENIYQEMGDFDTFEQAEKWMNNNLDSSIKYAGVNRR